MKLVYTKEDEQRALCRDACNICDPAGLTFTVRDYRMALRRRYKTAELISQPLAELHLSKMACAIRLQCDLYQYVEE